MASSDPNIDFDCPECDDRVSVSGDKSGNQIHCPHCGDRILVPSALSITEQILTGAIEDDEPEHPGSLKIDGISTIADDGSSWHIKCHVCDSVLLVSDQQVGTEVKCNDCYSMLRVKPNANAPRTRRAAVVDGSNLEVIEESPVSVPQQAYTNHDDSDELTLMPAVELDPEITDAQKISLLDDSLAADDSMTELTQEHLEEDDDPLPLMEPINAAKAVSPMFGLTEPESAASDDDEDDDSDEMIEVLDASPAELNQPQSRSQATTQLPRMPRKGKQAPAIAVDNGDESEAPVRVHAKRRRKRKSSGTVTAPASANRFAFDEASIGDILDKAMGVLKSPRIWVWAIVSISLMAIGGAIWQGIRPDRFESESFAEYLWNWGKGLLLGQGPFFIGYTILFFLGGVIFRETAQGETKVESVSVTDGSSFASTMLLFGFSMFIGSLPCMFFGLMPVSLAFQFFFAGILLFAAWKNQGAFSIVSPSVFNSFSTSPSSWKNWLIGASLAAAGGIVGGTLMEIPWPIISVFTSFAGAIIIVLATLLYAAITGWHCGTTVEQLRETE